MLSSGKFVNFCHLLKYLKKNHFYQYFKFFFFLGKTSFLYSSKLDDFIYAIAPPNGVIIEHVTPKRGARIQLLDMPGSKLTRHLWHNWFPKTEGNKICIPI